jgi:hypothetical protein
LLILLFFFPSYLTPCIRTVAAWSILEKLSLDIVLFPDWQPFPDQQSALFFSRRIAPVQVCLFVRGGGCAAGTATETIDFYVLPNELRDAYEKAVPAAAIDATTLLLPRTHTQTHAQELSEGTAAQTHMQPRQQRIRPPWLEPFGEQVVLVNWPILTAQVVNEVSQSVISDDASSQNRKTQTVSSFHCPCAIGFVVCA